jgi:hypothetical protein
MAITTARSETFVSRENIYDNPGVLRPYLELRLTASG